jgi:hypothetical protein
MSVSPEIQNIHRLTAFPPVSGSIFSSSFTNSSAENYIRTRKPVKIFLGSSKAKRETWGSGDFKNLPPDLFKDYILVIPAIPGER